MVRKSLHPGGNRGPEPAPAVRPLSEEAPLIDQEEVTVFHPEGAATDGNPFPEDLVAEEETTDYNSMTVPQLRDLLTERGLTVSGVKAELIARLEADDAGPSEEAPDESAEVPSEEAASSDEMPEEGDVSESGEQ
mgnify:CR=1 FL=1